MVKNEACEYCHNGKSLAYRVTVGKEIVQTLQLEIKGDKLIISCALDGDNEGTDFVIRRKIKNCPVCGRKL